MMDVCMIELPCSRTDGCLNGLSSHRPSMAGAASEETLTTIEQIGPLSRTFSGIRNHRAEQHGRGKSDLAHPMTRERVTWVLAYGKIRLSGQDRLPDLLNPSGLQLGFPGYRAEAADASYDRSPKPRVLFCPGFLDTGSPLYVSMLCDITDILGRLSWISGRRIDGHAGEICSSSRAAIMIVWRASRKFAPESLTLVDRVS